MVRVRWFDLIPVVWRIAAEFTRPRRSKWRPPFLPCTVAFLPVAASIAAEQGTVHWRRRAVLGIRRKAGKKLNMNVRQGRGR
jgi:hypothetical protein